MSPIVDINTKVLTSSPIVHMSGGERWERKASGRGNGLPRLIYVAIFTLLLKIFM